MPQEPASNTFKNPVALYFAATRPAFLTASLMACLLGLSIYWHDMRHLNTSLALITLLFAVMAHAGANVLNDYYDAKNGTDAHNTERIYPYTGGSRFIQNGVLTENQTRDFGFILLLCVALAGIWLMYRTHTGLIYIGLAGLFIGWAYSAPPPRLNSRGLGELCIAAGFLLIIAGADYVQRSEYAASAYIAGIPYALLAANLLYINQFPDRAADMSAGKQHWVARLEVRKARWGYLLIALIAYAALILNVALGTLPELALIALLSMPLSLQAARLLLRFANTPMRLSGAIKLSIAAMLAHGALLSLALISR
jgi:1,4-dihydroxy-2-naphthoate octaprenyltransferase